MFPGCLDVTYGKQTVLQRVCKINVATYAPAAPAR
ncbi:hypothetical protein GGR75_002154 [Xanthomonas campestris]|nr:hypothetical protein [Xanthomonas campestris]